MEVVSSHFSYHEEYIHTKSIAWLDRKHEQAMRERHDSYAENANSVTSGVYGALQATLSQMFPGNDKIDFNDLIVKGYEETLKKQQDKTEDAQDSGGGKFKTSFIERARAAQKEQG
jgi:hypothetical protein